jgi:hypothetical protein
MRSIDVRVEPTVRLVTGVKDVESLIALSKVMPRSTGCVELWISSFQISTSTPRQVPIRRNA